jgi:hypothetical protein
MIEIDLDAEDLACLGMRRANDEWSFPRLSLLDALGPAPKAKHARRPTIKQIERESGRVVTSVAVAPDGSRTFTFGVPEAAKATLTPLEAWKAKHARSA